MNDEPRVSISQRRADFRRLHEHGCFVIPSSGCAWSHGLPDNSMTREQVLEHLQIMVAATDLPINADFESGFGADPAAVYESALLGPRSTTAAPT